MSLARKIALAGLTLVFLLILITYFTGGPVFAVAPLLLPFVMILIFGKFFRRN
jgi:cytochrome b subunit of formate dehydrogenase